MVGSKPSTTLRPRAGYVSQVAFGEAGEKPEYFEFFCEKATMALFVNALRLGPAIKTQVTNHAGLQMSPFLCVYVAPRPIFTAV